MLEQEKRWELIQQGRPDDYHGVAIHPRHLSLFERVVLKRHHRYQPYKQQLPLHTAQTDTTATTDALHTAQTDTAASNGCFRGWRGNMLSHDSDCVTQLPIAPSDAAQPLSSPPEPATHRHQTGSRGP